MAQLNDLLVLGNSSLVGDVNTAGTFSGKYDIKNLNLTNSKQYYPLFVDGSSGSRDIQAHEYFYLWEGSSSDNRMYLSVGSHKDGHLHKGGLTIHDGKKNCYANIVPTDAGLNAVRTFYLPDTGGTFYTTANKPSPSDIGAAASNHGTHVSYGTSATAIGSSASAGSASTVSRSDHVHSAATLTIQGNGTTLTNGSYNGSSAKTVNITPGNIGAMPARPICIELSGSADGKLNEGFIDFHFNNSDEDYTSRIIEDALGQLNINNVTFKDGVITGGSVPWARLTNVPSSFTPASHTHTYIESLGNYTFDSSTLPNSFAYGVSTGFVNSNSGFGNYGSVLTVRSYTGGGGSLQLYAPYSPTYGGTHLKARFGNYDVSSGNSWTDLKEIPWLDEVLVKTTYEYSKQINIVNDGKKVCLGKFPMGDSGVEIEISMTTSTPYHGTLVFAAQNVTASSDGSAAVAKVYGDQSNSLASLIKYHRESNTNKYAFYLDVPSWGKVALRVKGMSLAGAPTNVGDTIASIPSGATKTPTSVYYTHPTHTAKSSGLYKITVDASGHVSAAAAVAKADITGLGISASDHKHAAGDITSGTLPITRGGTGATTAINARVNLISIGSNPITKVADDTVAKWGAYGPGATAFYSATGQLTDQPSQWGFIQNIMTTTGSELHQIWATQASGDMYHRGGNASGWSGTWRKFLDSTNYNTYSPTLTGGGASGTWGISITGNAATATSASKLTTNAGGTTTPVYFSGGVPNACTMITRGAWHGGLTTVGSDGVMEVGKYIDFHAEKTGTSDYDVRITAATTGLTISGTTSGTFKGSLDGNASTATQAKITNTALPTGSNTATYYSVFASDVSTGNRDLRGNTNIYYWENASSVYMCAGGSSVMGGITLQAGNGKYSNIVPASDSTGNYTFTLPKVSANSTFYTTGNKPTCSDIGAATSSHTHSNYVTTNTAQTISALKTISAGLKVSGRTDNSGDDEGIVVGWNTSNDYAGVTLGATSGHRSVFYLTKSSAPFWRYGTSDGEKYDLYHPGKGGTIATTDDVAGKANSSHTHSYLPLAGGNMTGHIYLTGANESSSSANSSQLVFGTSSNNHIVLSSNKGALVINPSTSSTSPQIVLYLSQQSSFPNGINAGTGGVTTTAAVNAGTYVKAPKLVTTCYGTSAPSGDPGQNGVLYFQII